MSLRLRILRSEFLKNVSHQMLGTGLAQALPFAATPILTRLYAKEDFALYTSFFAVSSILVVATGGRYQLAILLPKKDIDSMRIFTLSLYITFAYSFVLLVFALIFTGSTLNSIGLGALLVPVYVLFYGIWQSLSYLSVRNKTFTHNAISKVWQAFLYISAAIVLGQLNFLLFGLIIAKIFGVLGSGVYLFRKSFLKFRLIKLEQLKKIAAHYKDYPKYGVFPALLDVMSVQGLVLILTWFYPLSDLGHYGLTALALSAPVGLIGSSFRDVFYQKLADLLNRKEINTAIHFFKQSASGLFLIGFPICGILYFFGPAIFSVVFGKQWNRSGEFASALSLSFLVQLVVSPLSSVFNAANKVKVAAAWQVLYFITTFLTLGTSAYIVKVRISTLFSVYVIHELVLYTVYFVLQYRTLKRLS